METYYVVLWGLGSYFLGFASHHFITKFRKDKHSGTESRIPDIIPQLDDTERGMLQLYLKEWEIIIDTQMHFNDLILRFRAITLTTFVALIGAAVAINKLDVITQSTVQRLLLLIGCLWAASFIIDYWYYHRLLLGSVKQATKYDKSRFAQEYGIFGMTASISEQVRPFTSKSLIIFYYSVPSVALILMYLLL
jgi:hypothetical protein